jgi:hypothetical protein
MRRDGCYGAFFASHQIAAIDLNNASRHPRRRLNDESSVALPAVKATGTRLCGRAGFS